MESVICEMHENLKEDFYVAFVSANNTCSALFKSDSFKFLDEKTILIRRKSGGNSIINLEMIMEISVRCIK